ncbi:MAG: hypothetical protein Q7K43_05795, partial [Candidatus Woesearchaeota archaeon]|nr:hypothetical protein [Candidatus Woesearchaeota archaeon]
TLVRSAQQAQPNPPQSNTYLSNEVMLSYEIEDDGRVEELRVCVTGDLAQQLKFYEKVLFDSPAARIQLKLQQSFGEYSARWFFETPLYLPGKEFSIIAIDLEGKKTKIIEAFFNPDRTYTPSK